MQALKRYSPTTINFHLLPDLMAAVQSSVPQSMLADGGQELRLTPLFEITTSSQVATTADYDEFKEILRSLEEPITALDAELECRLILKHLEMYTRKPPAFKLHYRQDRLEVAIARNTAFKIKELFSRIEEVLSLKTLVPTLPSEEEPPRKKTAFLAHSFDPLGKSYAYELVKYLSLLGFEVSTGEGFSPERISKKVRKRLTSREIVVMIGTCLPSSLRPLE
jgi:hypothetical protein